MSYTESMGRGEHLGHAYTILQRVREHEKREVRLREAQQEEVAEALEEDRPASGNEDQYLSAEEIQKCLDAGVIEERDGKLYSTESGKRKYEDRSWH